MGKLWKGFIIKLLLKVSGNNELNMWALIAAQIQANPALLQSYNNLISNNPREEVVHLFQAWVESNRINQIEYARSLRTAYDKAHYYSLVVITIGYVGFFSLWHLLNESKIIPDYIHSLVGILMVVSIFLYLFGEVLLNVIDNLKNVLSFWDYVRWFFFGLLPSITGFSALLILGYYFAKYLAINAI